jgi:uncharacterized protein YerC
MRLVFGAPGSVITFQNHILEIVMVCISCATHTIGKAGCTVSATRPCVACIGSHVICIQNRRARLLPDSQISESINVLISYTNILSESRSENIQRFLPHITTLEAVELADRWEVLKLASKTLYYGQIGTQKEELEFSTLSLT